MDEQELRARIEKRVTQQAELLLNVISFVTITPLLWLLWRATQDWIAFPWPALVTVGWILGLVSHAFEVYKERIIDYFTARELRQMGAYDKPKRLRMTDDGELASGDATEALQRQTKEA